ncbi:MAG: glycosyltransferase family 2 protein [Odoribacter sp.]
MNTISLAIVVPCYNEEAVLPETVKQLSAVLDRMKGNGQIGIGRILFVDDGSKDKTWEIIATLGQENESICGIKLAHNVGHQYALLAGLEWAANHVDVAVSIDADLQDDVDAIEEMTSRFIEGADIVYGVRRERTTDTWFKKNSALLFYLLIRKMGTDVVYNHADFRLMSQRALKALISYPERNLFLRGIVRLIGFPEAYVYYDRKSRFAGESKYPLKKMLSFALDGITSFSDRPLRLIISGGFFFAVIAPLLMIVYALVQYSNGHTIPGWTSLLISLWFIGGIIMISIGITGIYIGKIYKEVKQRPRYFIEEDINLRK